MLKARLILVLLFVAGFSLATCLQIRRAAGETAEQQPDDVLAMVLGDGKKMFANEFFVKADAYFHRGNYPSIFDANQHHEENHMAGETHEEHGHAGEDHDDHDEALAPPTDWIQRFGRHFYPTQHVHLEEGSEKEMLPWLRLSAQLDPHRVQTYTVTAYWLRTRLGKVDEAEQFLRDGLRANPNSPDLLYELGRLFFENRKDFFRAKNVWLAALHQWHVVEEPKEKPDLLLVGQILAGLSQIAVQDGHIGEAVDYLNQLKAKSPSPDEVDELLRQAAPAAGK
jgi:tetratricopeptide (TPR) repeat protein